MSALPEVRQHGTAVVNLNHIRPEARLAFLARPEVTYIGRRVGKIPASKWQNPFRIGRDGTREECVEMYRSGHLPDRPELMAALGELSGQILACWCDPLFCHGHILARLAETRTKAAT